MFAMSSSQRIQMPYISRAVLCYFLPFARIRIEEQNLAEVTLKFLPSILSFPQYIWGCKNDQLASMNLIRSWLQWSNIWGRGKRELENYYVMYKVPFTAFPHARNHAHGKHSDQLHSQLHERTKIWTSKLLVKLMKSIWESDLLYLHGRQKTVHVFWSLDKHV